MLKSSEELIANSQDICRLLRILKNRLEIARSAVRTQSDKDEMNEDIDACGIHITALRKGIADELAAMKGSKPGTGNGAAMANDPANSGNFKFYSDWCGCKECAYQRNLDGKQMQGHPLIKPEGC